MSLLWLDRAGELNMRNHPCQDKCPNFTDEQCYHCLVKDLEAREFALGVAPYDAYVKAPVELTSDEQKFLNQADQAKGEVT